MNLLIVFFCLAASTSAAAWAGVITLVATRDNTIFEDVEGDTSNGAGPALFAGNNGQNLARRALVFFDVAGQVPAGANVDSVVLTLRVSNASNTILRQFTLHRVLKTWGEGISFATGGAGAPATDRDATWIHTLYPTQTWSTPGGDFDDAASASLLTGGVGTYVCSGIVMTADVQSWLASPGANHGWLVRGDETSLNTARRFDSREAATPAYRPALTIHFTEPTAARSTTWGSIKARYR